MLGTITSKIFAGVGLLTILAFIGVYMWGNSYKHKFELLEIQTKSVVEAVQDASNNDDVTWSTVVEQIKALGEDVQTLKVQIKEQNMRIDELAEEAIAAKANAKKKQEIAAKAIAQRNLARRQLAKYQDVEAIDPKTIEDFQFLLERSERAIEIIRETAKETEV